MINEYKIAKSAVLKAGKILLDYYSLDYNISTVVQNVTGEKLIMLESWRVKLK